VVGVLSSECCRHAEFCRQVDVTPLLKKSDFEPQMVGVLSSGGCHTRDEKKCLRVAGGWSFVNRKGLGLFLIENKVSSSRRLLVFCCPWEDVTHPCWKRCNAPTSCCCAAYYYVKKIS
jgi:hypothetical protein